MNARALSQTQSSSTSSFTPAPVNLVQRKCACGGSAGLSGECAECQKGKLVGENAPLVQPKLKISQPNDKYEREADRVADEVMRMPESRVQRQVGVEEEEDEETVQTKPIASQITPLIQKQVENEDDEEEQIQLKPRSNGEIIQNKKSINDEGIPSNPFIVHKAAQSTDHSLDLTTRNFMESRFGHDLSEVKIHTDNKVAASAQSLNARAYTLGRDIMFGASEYQPQTTSGKHLLAHELAHYLQQKSGNGNQTVMRVEVADCEEKAESDLLLRHFRAQRLLKKAIEMTNERNTRGERTQAVKAALLEWFKIDLDSPLLIENARNLKHVETAMQTTLDGSDNIVYECDEDRGPPIPIIGIESIGNLIPDEICKPGRNAVALLNVHICPTWWTNNEDRQAMILIHEWGHKHGQGINRFSETYCGDEDFKDLPSNERIQMPDAYEGYISELSIGKGTC